MEMNPEKRLIPSTLANCCLYSSEPSLSYCYKLYQVSRKLEKIDLKVGIYVAHDKYYRRKSEYFDKKVKILSQLKEEQLQEGEKWNSYLKYLEEHIVVPDAAELFVQLLEDIVAQRRKSFSQSKHQLFLKYKRKVLKRHAQVFTLESFDDHYLHNELIGNHIDSQKQLEQDNSEESDGHDTVDGM